MRGLALPSIGHRILAKPAGLGNCGPRFAPLSNSWAESMTPLSVVR
jgi:hypothetical protein